MQIIQSRRDFLASAVGGRRRGPPRRAGDRSPTRRRRKRPRSACRMTTPAICVAPAVRRRGAAARGRLHRRPLRASAAGRRHVSQMRRPRRDRFRLALRAGARPSPSMPASRSRSLAGVHPGCFELFAHERIRSITDLKGKSVGVQTLGSSGAPASWRSWRPMSGSIPTRTSMGRPAGRATPMELFAEGKIDAFLGFPPEPQELRARKIGHVILNTRHRPAVVAVLLLHAGRQRGLCPRTIRSRPSASARHPQGRRPLRRRAGAGRATAGRWRLHRALRLRAADADASSRTTTGASTTPRTRCGSTRCACTRSA